MMTSRSTAISVVDGVACYTPGQYDVGRAVSLLPASTKVNKKTEGMKSSSMCEGAAGLAQHALTRHVFNN